MRTSTWVGLKLANGRYEINRMLGQGGMALVYRAYDVNLETEVVVKTPRQALLDDAEFLGRFRREIRSLVQLSHPHIVKIIDVGEHDGAPFAVMQYLAGGSMEDRIPHDENGVALPMPLADIVPWIVPLAGALDFIHSQNFVHRDIKPANVLFDEAGNVYLSDFGIAKAASGVAGKSDRGLTEVGLVLGTVDYMAPEAVMGEELTGAADQYSLGVMVFELLCGRKPFSGANSNAVMVKQTSQPPPLLRSIVPSISESVCEKVRRALAKEPGQRHSNCAAFAEALTAEMQAGRTTQRAAAAGSDTVRRKTAVQPADGGAPPRRQTAKQQAGQGPAVRRKTVVQTAMESKLSAGPKEEPDSVGAPTQYLSPGGKQYSANRTAFYFAAGAVACLAIAYLAFRSGRSGEAKPSQLASLNNEVVKPVDAEKAPAAPEAKGTDREAKGTEPSRPSETASRPVETTPPQTKPEDSVERSTPAPEHQADPSPPPRSEPPVATPPSSAPTGGGLGSRGLAKSTPFAKNNAARNKVGKGAAKSNSNAASKQPKSAGFGDNDHSTPRSEPELSEADRSRREAEDQRIQTLEDERRLKVANAVKRGAILPPCGTSVDIQELIDIATGKQKLKLTLPTARKESVTEVVGVVRDPITGSMVPQTVTRMVETAESRALRAAAKLDYVRRAERYFPDRFEIFKNEMTAKAASNGRYGAEILADLAKLEALVAAARTSRTDAESIAKVVGALTEFSVKFGNDAVIEPRFYEIQPQAEVAATPSRKEGAAGPKVQKDQEIEKLRRQARQKREAAKSASASGSISRAEKLYDEARALEEKADRLEDERRKN